MRGATIHWVDAATAIDAEVRLYDNLFTDARTRTPPTRTFWVPEPQLLEVLTGCKGGAFLADAAAPASFQFMRLATSAWTARTPSPAIWCSTDL